MPEVESLPVYIVWPLTLRTVVVEAFSPPSYSGYPDYNWNYASWTTPPYAVSCRCVVLRRFLTHPIGWWPLSFAADKDICNSDELLLALVVAPPLARPTPHRLGGSHFKMASPASFCPVTLRQAAALFLDPVQPITGLTASHFHLLDRLCYQLFGGLGTHCLMLIDSSCLLPSGWED